MYEWRQADYLISTDRSKIDLALIHSFLVQSYWAEGIPIEIVQRSIDNSLPFGVYHCQGYRTTFCHHWDGNYR